MKYSLPLTGLVFLGLHQLSPTQSAPLCSATYNEATRHYNNGGFSLAMVLCGQVIEMKK